MCAEEENGRRRAKREEGKMRERNEQVGQRGVALEGSGLSRTAYSDT